MEKKTPSKELRTLTVSSMFSESEMKRLDEYRVGTARGTFVRNLVFSKDKPVSIHKDNRKTYAEMTEISAKINKAIGILNPDEAKGFSDILDDIRSVQLSLLGVP